MNIFNYGAVYMLAPWDSRDSKIPMTQAFFGGIYTDINAYWFNDVGNLIVSTMLFNAYYPIIEFFGYFAMRFAFRCLDQRTFWPNKPTETQSKTI